MLHGWGNSSVNTLMQGKAFHVEGTSSVLARSKLITLTLKVLVTIIYAQWEGM